MSIAWILIAALAALLLVLLGYVLLSLRKIGTPTQGERIDRASRTASALIVIDVQQDFTRQTGKNAYEPATREAALAQIKKNIRAAKDEGRDVIFIKQVFRDWPAILAMKMVAGGAGTPGRDGLKIDTALDTNGASTFEKAVGDAFSSGAFERFLTQNNIGHVQLVGLDACHCVQLTAKGALSRGFSVEILEPSLLTVTPQKWDVFKRQLSELGCQFRETVAQAA